MIAKSPSGSHACFWFGPGSSCRTVAQSCWSGSRGQTRLAISGLEDEIDNHWGELFKAALLSTVLGVGAELGSGADTGSNTDIIQALRLSAANSLNQTGQQVVRRNLNIQPTLTICPGFPVRVIVNRDLVLEPYRG